MTALSRPLIGLLSSAFDAAVLDEREHVELLRSTLTVALRRCLDAPDASWPELVGRGAAVGEWDEWRTADLIAAADPAGDPRPEVTRDTLATLAEELIARGDVRSGPWEGADREAAVGSPRWQEGQRRREIVFAIERAMVSIADADADGLRDGAARIDERDTTVAFPGLPAALRGCATDIETGGLTIAGRCGVARRARRHAVRLARSATAGDVVAAVAAVSRPSPPSAARSGATTRRRTPSAACG